MATVSRMIKQTIRTPVDWFAAHFGPHMHKPKTPTLWILMYHRILPKTDPRYALEEPGMIVEPDTFRQHLGELKSLFEMISLDEWVDQCRKGLALPQKACAITFDDGWLDNYQYAFPILREQQVPATLFAVTDMIGTNRSFWPNRLNRLMQLHPDALAGTNYPEALPPRPGNHNQLREYMASVINSMKVYSDLQITEWLDEAEKKAGIGQDQPSLMSWSQLSEMHSSGLVTIGSHTCNHYRLRDDLPEETIIHEITESKRRLENELDAPVNLFCYPNGDVSRLALKMVSTHYSAAVTTSSGIVSSSSLQPHQLSRMGIHQDRCQTRNGFLSRLSAWR